MNNAQQKHHVRRCVDCRKRRRGYISNLDGRFRCDECRENIRRANAAAELEGTEDEEGDGW